MFECALSLTPQELELVNKWHREGTFEKDGVTYIRGRDEYEAVFALIPPSKKVNGMICHIGELTLTNSDLNEDYHEGFTIGNGKTMYWMMIWHSRSGNVTVFSRDKCSRRYVTGDSMITVHFK